MKEIVWIVGAVLVFGTPALAAKPAQNGSHTLIRTDHGYQLIGSTTQTGTLSTGEHRAKKDAPRLRRPMVLASPIKDRTQPENRSSHVLNTIRDLLSGKDASVVRQHVIAAMNTDASEGARLPPHQRAEIGRKRAVDALQDLLTEVPEAMQLRKLVASSGGKLVVASTYLSAGGQGTTAHLEYHTRETLGQPPFLAVRYDGQGSVTPYIEARADVGQHAQALIQRFPGLSAASVASRIHDQVRAWQNPR